MQVDKKFTEGVDFLLEQLRKAQFGELGWSEVINQGTGQTVSDEAVKSAAAEFPDAGDIGRKFDLSELKKTLEALVTDDQGGVSVGELQAAEMQTRLLLACRRYYARRKQSRASRIVHAAHRRAILSHAQGPIQRDLRRTVENMLVDSR